MKLAFWIKLSCVLAWFAQVYLVAYLPELADEAYYKRWSEQLDWGYFDHPPAVAWWFLAGGRILNLCLLPLAWFNFIWAGRLLGARQSPWLVCLIAWSTPLGLASGVLVTPDIPLLFCWSLATLGYALASYPLMTLALSLALWSKAMILPAMSGLLYLCWTDQRLKSNQRQIRCILMCLTIFILYIPQLYWSANHHWLPWSFQGGRQWRLLSSFEFLAGQFLVGGGLWFIYLLNSYKEFIVDHYSIDWLTSNWVKRTVFRQNITSGPTSVASTSEETVFKSLEFDRVCFFLSVPTMLCFSLVSLLFRVEANWTALAWPMGLVWLVERLPYDKLIRAWKGSLLFVLPCLLLPIIHHLIPLSWGPPRDGEKLKNCLNAVQNSQPDIRYWVAGRYQEAALLGLNLDQHNAQQLSKNHRVSIIYQKAFGRRQSQYDLSVNRQKLQQEHLTCHSLWLGPKQWAQGICAAENIDLKEEDKNCRLSLSRCRCPVDKHRTSVVE